MSIKLLNRVVGALAAALIASPCLAADEATNEDEPQMEEIIVTATYRDTRLMDTPLAISAVTAEDMVAKGIEDIRTLYQSIPGLAYAARQSSNFGGYLSIRGITPMTTPGSIAPVGVYLDNIPITDSVGRGNRQTLGSLFDMNRVEVLKGPQGTLYGEGSMGGSVRYITNKPDTSGLDYQVQSSFESSSKSNDLSYRIDAMVNIPLADQLALRLVGFRRDRAGVLDTVAPRNQKDVDTFEENGLRAAFKWDASETFEVTAMVNVVDNEFGGPGTAFHCYTEPNPSDPPNGQIPVYDLPGTTCARGKSDLFDHGDPYVTHLAHPTMPSGGWTDQTNYNLSIEWELPFADLVSSTSYFEREGDGAQEGGPNEMEGVAQFFNELACFGQIPVCGPNTVNAIGLDNVIYRTSERIVQEFRLISNTDGPLQWTLGAYYKDDDGQAGRHTGCYKGGPSPAYATFDNCQFLFGFYPEVPLEDQPQIIAWAQGAFGAGNTIYQGFKEQAIYGEASYRLSDQWELQLGLRLSEVEVRSDIARPGIDSKVDPIFSLTKSSDIESPKVVLTWRPIEDWMVYATYSEGFRPGLINDRLITKIGQLQTQVDNVCFVDFEEGTCTDEDTAAAIQAEIDRTSAYQTAEGDFVENYELGTKVTVLDGRLSFTGSLYRIAFENFVLRIRDRFPRGLPGGRNVLYAVNVGSAESEGMELEVRLALTDDLFLTFGGDKSFANSLVDISGSVPEGDLQIRGITAGSRMSNAPDHSYYASLAYDFELFGMNATARVDTYGVDSSFHLTASAFREVTPGYKKTDVKLLVNRDNWMLSAYVRNITDDRIAYELHKNGYSLGPPRTLGVQVHYRM